MIEFLLNPFQTGLSFLEMSIDLFPFGLVLILFLALGAFSFFAYFLPSVIALYRRHPFKYIILLLNLVAFFSLGIAWLAALIWACILPNRTSEQEEVASHSTADQLEKLYRLKNEGAISETEFEQEKQYLLYQKEL